MLGVIKEMSNQKKHLEEVSQKYPVKNKQKKVVENNVTENRFSAIKRSVKKPKDIDEKIEYLEKECQKTGLNEITMSTSGIYSVQGEENLLQCQIKTIMILKVNLRVDMDLE